jgi:hypothetical protein
MGFAEGYLQKHAIGGPFIKEAPDPDLNCIVAIPATEESGLLKCLDSLYICQPPPLPVEVIVLLNSSEKSSTATIETNRHTFEAAREWSRNHSRPGLQFHIVLAEGLPAKHHGAGLARKLVMDEAVRRLNAIEKGGRPEGVIVSLDADCTVRGDYLREITGMFGRFPELEGCSVAFEHPLEGDEFPEPVYEAIVNYELHQRTYLEAVRYTGYPYAYHTVGSAFAVRASTYCRQGGMSRRQAGEDFYFIQKVAGQGNYGECNSTRVYPSPRPSARVPFGTGPDIARQIAGKSLPGSEGTRARGGEDHIAVLPPYYTYPPPLFDQLKEFYSRIPSLFSTTDPAAVLSGVQPLLRQYLKTAGFLETLKEVRENTASEAAFRQRFFKKFNMLWILKFLHYAEAEGVAKMEVETAAKEMLERIGSPAPADSNKRALLQIYRLRAVNK